MRLNVESIVLQSGMLAVVLYSLHVIIGGILWEGYNHLHQPISDLTSSGAPNRSLLLFLTNAYGILALIFAISFTLLKGSQHNRLVVWGGISFIIMHILSISYSFFPQDLPGSLPTFSGKMHFVVTVLIVPFTIVSPFLIGIGLRKSKELRNLGNYSIVCGVLIFVFGGLTGIFFANHLPYFGLVERLNIGVLQIWTFLLSFKISK